MDNKQIAESIKADIKVIIEYSDEEILKVSEHFTNTELALFAVLCGDLQSQYNTAQMVAKILMNSLYGAIGNAYFPLFNEDIACAITGNGRYFIRKLANYIEDTLQKMHKSDKPYIIYGDTDSVYFHIEPFMNAYIEQHPDKSIDDYVTIADNFEKKIVAPIIQKCITDFARELNSYNVEMIGCEREIIADRAVFCAKKAYFARVRDNEGTRYPEEHPKIKVMGMDVAKSGTPKWSKKKLKEAIPTILDSSEIELKDWLRSIREDYANAPLSEICNIQGVNNLEYTLGEKGVPIGARSSLVYNNYVVDNKMDDIYQTITAGDKTKRLNLQIPNKFKSNIIGFMDDNFTKVIDRSEVDLDTQYEKTFLKLLNLMTKSLNYKIFQETQEIDDW